MPKHAVFMAYQHFRRSVTDLEIRKAGRWVSLERVAQVISLLGDHDSMERLVKLEVLSVALGNLDLHAKNLSVLHLPDGSMSLAPAYDVVP